jgi:small multidrug resistance family-3 protein
VGVVRAAALFAAAAIFEIGGAFLIWRAVREGGAWWLALAGGFALFAYGFVATFQSDPHFGRILAAYGGVFVAGSLACGVAFDGFRPDRWDLAGAAICLIGVAVIMAPRGS